MCSEPGCPVGWEFSPYEDSCRRAGPLSDQLGMYSLKAMRYFFGECYGKAHFFSETLNTDIHIEPDSVAPIFIPCDNVLCRNHNVRAEEFLAIFYRSWWPLAESWLKLTIPAW